MELKVGDIVEFKKYEDMTDDEKAFIIEGFFPKYGKVKEIRSDGHFIIESSGLVFNPKSIARVISDVDVDSFKPGDEVWVKTTVNVCYDDTVFINPVERFAKKYNLKKVKHEEPERFIVKENYYGMYIGVELKLVSNKDAAQVYASRDAAYQEATDMHLNAYDVIPYGD